MTDEWPDWNGFKEKIDADLKTKGKGEVWKKDICLGFAEAVRKLEEEKGRPVYFGEVLYDLDKKAGTEGRLSEGIRRELRLSEKKARTARLVRAVSAKEVADAAKTRITADGLASQVRKLIEGQIKDISRWACRPRTGELFQPNEPFLYCVSENVEGTAFKNMDGCKSEKNVARQFARWALQPRDNRKSYLKL